MAKTKSKPQSDNTIDGAATEKLQSLKSLNELLLKETSERRKQVDSLTRSKTVLESKLTQCNSLNVSLSEQAVRLEIERGVEARVCTVEMAGKFEGLVRDLDLVVKEKSEFERVMNVKELEIGSLKSEINRKLQSENAMWLRVREVEKNEAELLEELRRMKDDYDGLVNEKGTVEMKMDLVVREKDLVEKNLVESNRLIDELKMCMDEVTEEKNLVEVERDLQEREKNELQSSVDDLNALVRKLQQEKTQLVDEVAELENTCLVSLDNEVKMRTEIDVLVKEIRDLEVDVGRLTEEKRLVAKGLDDALERLKNQNIERTQLVDEKEKINDAKNQAESDAIRLKEQLEELKNTVATLEKSSFDQTDKIKRLESENRRFIAASEQATKERNNVQVSLDGEKQKVSKIEKDMEDMQKKLSNMQKENQKLIAEKKNLENAYAMLQKEHDETNGKLRLSQANTSIILEILKNTSSICNSKENNNMGTDEGTDVGEEIKPHVKEVEAIKKAFKDKESVADETKQQLELLKVRVAKAEKGKNFWTKMSSATTVLAGAAFSLAYVAWGGN